MSDRNFGFGFGRNGHFGEFRCFGRNGKKLGRNRTEILSKIRSFLIANSWFWRYKSNYFLLKSNRLHFLSTKKTSVMLILKFASIKWALMQLSPIESNHNLYQEDMKSKCNLLKMYFYFTLRIEMRENWMENPIFVIKFEIFNFGFGSAGFRWSYFGFGFGSAETKKVISVAH